jgi:hypothetical protein
MTLIESVLIIGAVGALVSTTCYNIRRSRCEKIESPCLSCVRKVMTEKEMRFDTMNRTNSQPDTPKTNLTAT